MTVTRVVYKPDTQSTDEFLVMVDPEEYKKWKEDKSVALALVVGTFTIYFSNQGHQGKLGQASKQQIESVFGTTSVDEAIQIILEKGTSQSASGLGKGSGNINDARGNVVIDTRGKGLQGI